VGWLKFGGNIIQIREGEGGRWREKGEKRERHLFFRCILDLTCSVLSSNTLST